MKIQTKITALFTLLCTSIIAILSFSIYYFTYKNASQDFYTRLELRARIAARGSLESDPGTAAFNEIRKEHLQLLPNEKELIINTDTIAQLKNIPHYHSLPADFIQAVILSGKASYRDDYDFFQGLFYANNGKKFIVIVSAENIELKGFLYNLKKIMITGCIISIIIIFSVGLFFSREILAPLRNVTRQVQRITGTSLHLRLNMKKGKDEMAALTTTFNDMLDRLETAFETQNNFVSNASHELNTPLTAIIGEADYALSKVRSAEQYRQSLSIIMQQGDKLTNITKSLVQLARSGFQDNLKMEAVNLNELLHNAKNNVNYVYSSCNIELPTGILPETAVIIYGNQQLLELALSNVLLNACKYSNSLPVSVSINVSRDEVTIAVKDKGIGIPKDEQKKIFDPFFRASNVRSIDGYGIGLPLTQNIVRLHKGHIDIYSHVDAGTEVIIKLPSSQPAIGRNQST